MRFSATGITKMTRLVGSGLILIALAIPSLVSAQATRKRQLFWFSLIWKVGGRR